MVFVAVQYLHSYWYLFYNHIIGVFVPYQAYPGFALAELDGIAVFIHIVCGIGVCIAGPGAFGHFSLGENLYFHVIVTVATEGEVVVCISYFSVAVLEYDVVVGQLFSGAFINVRAAVLVAVVFSVFFVVFKVSLYLAEAVGQVFLFSSGIEEKGLLSGAVVGLLSVRGKGKFGFMGIMVGLAVAEFINVFLKALDIYIYVMGGPFFWRCAGRCLRQDGLCLQRRR